METGFIRQLLIFIMMEHEKEKHGQIMVAGVTPGYWLLRLYLIWCLSLGVTDHQVENQVDTHVEIE